jgi:hypothetical protein
MRLWSVSTTVRNPERIRSFLKVLKELYGETWNNATQKRYQILLLQRKAYGINVPEFEKTLTKKHLDWLHSDTFTYEQAEKILNAKNYKGGGEMRGRQLFNPLEKMGLAYIDVEKRNQIKREASSLAPASCASGTPLSGGFLHRNAPGFGNHKRNCKGETV